jgi:hypothetical protein
MERMDLRYIVITYANVTMKPLCITNILIKM